MRTSDAHPSESTSEFCQPLELSVAAYENVVELLHPPAMAYASTHVGCNCKCYTNQPNDFFKNSCRTGIRRVLQGAGQGNLTNGTDSALTCSIESGWFAPLTASIALCHARDLISLAAAKGYISHHNLQRPFESRRRWSNIRLSHHSASMRRPV